MQPLWRLLAAPFVCLLLLAAGPAHAQSDPVAFVKTVTGDAFVTTNGQAVKAAPGVPVQVGSELRTEPGATLGITFKDNTLMSFGPRTTFVVDTFTYAPAEGKLGLAGSLTRGTLNYVSGIIAKLRPESVSVKTPTGVIGVRGTEFVAKVDAP